MSVLELKAKLHRLVDETDDDAQLWTWFKLLSGQLQDEEIEMTPEWEARLQEVQEGRVTPDEQVQAEIKEWLRNRKAQSELGEAADEISK